MKEEGIWTKRLIERLAPLVKDAEPYPIVEIAEGSVVVGAYAIPDVKNPRILVLAESIKDLEKMPLEEETPEEFAIHSLENIARLVKKRHGKTKIVVVLSEYDDKRFSREKAKNLCEYVDLLLVNEEIKEFSKSSNNINSLL